MSDPKNTPTQQLFLESTSSLLGRAYYMQLGVLDRVLKAEGLEKSLRPGMCNVLFALLAKDGQTISSIANCIRVAKSTMSGTVVRLKKTGLVNVVVDSKDKRAQRLKLTVKGKNLESSLISAMAQVEDVIGAKMSKSEKVAFSSSLNLAIEAMKESTGQESEPAQGLEQ